MKTSRVLHIRRLLASAWLAAAMAGPVTADDEREEHEGLPAQVEEGQIMSLAELRRIVLARVEGDIVSARIEQEHGLSLYEFRVLRADGRLVEVEVDAGTGKIREVEND